MKKIILITAALISTAAFAQDNDRFVRNQPSHKAIPNLKFVGTNAQSAGSKNADKIQFEYVGAATPNDMKIDTTHHSNR